LAVANEKLDEITEIDERSATTVMGGVRRIPEEYEKEK
jgi:hypothetical protein